MVKESKQAFRSRKPSVIHLRTAKAAPVSLRERAQRIGIIGLLAVARAACIAWGVVFENLLAQVKASGRCFISSPNDKLARTGTFSFPLPAGFSCPGAGACITACFAMVGNYGTITVEMPRIWNLLYLYVYGLDSWVENMVRGIKSRGRDQSGARVGVAQAGVRVPLQVLTFRWHDSGDFFSQEYLDAAVRVMRACPEVIFYCYTKSLNLDWKEALVLPNFNRVQSAGGRWDSLIDENLPHAILVSSAEALAQAEAAGYVYGSESEIPAITGERKIVLVELSQKKKILAEKEGN
jgi:hypothetical protein